MPPTPPPCTALGPQCQELPVTLRIGSFEGDPSSLDHEATWLLGHTARIGFGGLHQAGKDLLVDAVLQVRCRHLKSTTNGGSAPAFRCAAHGYAGTLPAPRQLPDQPRRLGGDEFTVVTAGELARMRLPLPARSLPVVEQDVNPCSIAPCRTADHTLGSACCRDMQLEIMCTPEETTLEALVRSRQSPYLCKVERDSPRSLDVEVISACRYLDDAGENCTLHGRSRPDGRPAKPDLCSEWPDDGKGLHPGCIWYTPPAGGRKRSGS